MTAIQKAFVYNQFWCNEKSKRRYVIWILTIYRFFPPLISPLFCLFPSSLISTLLFPLFYWLSLMRSVYVHSEMCVSLTKTQISAAFKWNPIWFCIFEKPERKSVQWSLGTLRLVPVLMRSTALLSIWIVFVPFELWRLSMTDIYIEYLSCWIM